MNIDEIWMWESEIIWRKKEEELRWKFSTKSQCNPPPPVFFLDKVISKTKKKTHSNEPDDKPALQRPEESSVVSFCRTQPTPYGTATNRPQYPSMIRTKSKGLKGIVQKRWRLHVKYGGLPELFRRMLIASISLSTIWMFSRTIIWLTARKNGRGGGCREA